MSQARKKLLIIAIVVAVVAVAVLAVVKLTGGKQAYRTIEIIECVGEGSVFRDGKEIAAYEGMKLRSADTVSVKEDSYLRMKLDRDKYVYLEGAALITLIAEGNEKDSKTVVNTEAWFPSMLREPLSASVTF